MLSLILTLMTDPASSVLEPSPLPSIRLQSLDDRFLARAQRQCSNPRFQPALEGSSSPIGDRPVVNDLLYREGDTLQRYLLLDRRIENCSVPISFSVQPVRLPRSDQAPLSPEGVVPAY